MQLCLWSSLNLRKLVNALVAQEHRVSASVVGKLLHGLGYGRQTNSKVKEGGGHIDRDAQFRFIKDQAKRFLAADEPVVSVDTKKEGLGGDEPVIRVDAIELRPGMVQRLRYQASLAQRRAEKASSLSLA
jgi:Rhodopirellula transposase DDE domain